MRRLFRALEELAARVRLVWGGARQTRVFGADGRNRSWRQAGSILQRSWAFILNTNRLWNFRGPVTWTDGCLRTSGGGDWR